MWKHSSIWSSILGRFESTGSEKNINKKNPHLILTWHPVQGSREQTYTVTKGTPKRSHCVCKHASEQQFNCVIFIMVIEWKYLSDPMNKIGLLSNNQTVTKMCFNKTNNNIKLLPGSVWQSWLHQFNHTNCLSHKPKCWLVWYECTCTIYQNKPTHARPQLPVRLENWVAQ